MLKIKKKTAYVMLMISIFLEVLGASFLEACEGFSIPSYTFAVIVTLTLSYFLFSKILRVIDLAIGYATWTAVGLIATAFIGFVFFHQGLSPVGWVAVIVMMVSVVALNLFGTPKEAESKEEKGGAL